MAPRLPMSRTERDAFLMGRHVGVISIEDEGRGPISAPIWYDYTPQAGLWVITARDSRKGVALERAGRFSLVAQQEDMPYRYVSVEGPIVERRPADTEKDRRPMAQRYFGVEFGNAYVDSDPGEGNVLYRMQPERWLTVDYGKLAGPA
jgi:nitroimidazol reductase NimA-like FMN-containing flavoprotein (pyridoxamine 5'-phosphate oxidase superfamily)